MGRRGGIPALKRGKEARRQGSTACYIRRLVEEKGLYGGGLKVEGSLAVVSLVSLLPNCLPRPHSLSLAFSHAPLTPPSVSPSLLSLSHDSSQLSNTRTDFAPAVGSPSKFSRPAWKVSDRFPAAPPSPVPLKWRLYLASAIAFELIPIAVPLDCKPDGVGIIPPPPVKGLLSVYSAEAGGGGALSTLPPAWQWSMTFMGRRAFLFAIVKHWP